MTNCPNHLARGIRFENCAKFRKVRICAFKFQDLDRKDDKLEMSIQWLCNPDAERILKANGQPNPLFYPGFAVIEKDRLMKVLQSKEFQKLG